MKANGVMKKMCGTCPFRHDSKYKYLASGLAKSALTEASRICHSTGSNNGINRRTGKPPMFCRGARDLQLKYFCTIGFLKEPTDAEWERRAKELKSNREGKP